MKKCKYCKSEIDTDAKICPNCHKKQGMPIWAIVLIVLGVLVVIASAGSNSTDNDTKQVMDNSSNSSENAKTSNSKKDDDAKFEYNIDNQYESSFSYYIEGTVKNNTSKDYSYFSIEFICYDADGNNLGTAVDNTNSLLANQTWKYKAMFIGSNSDNVDHCDYHEMTKW